jgi:hypothetical protein
MTRPAFTNAGGLFMIRFMRAGFAAGLVLGLASPALGQMHQDTDTTHSHSQMEGMGHSQEGEMGHSHEMAEVHGGSVTMTETNHFEVLFTAQGLHVYVYGPKQKPLDTLKGVTGKVTLMDKEGAETNLDLSYVAPDPEKGRTQGYLAAEQDFATVEPGQLKALVMVKGLGKEPISFKMPVSVDEETVYVCPMNDSPPAHDPMKCPNCGMQMVPQEKEAEAGDMPMEGHGDHDHR